MTSRPESEGAAMEKRSCENCGNVRCSNSLVAFWWDECVESGFTKHWRPKAPAETRHDRPLWQLPAPSETTQGANAYIPASAKYHCFVGKESLCKRHAQKTEFYSEIEIESGEVLRNPDIACKRCREVWLRRYVPEEVTP